MTKTPAMTQTPEIKRQHIDDWLDSEVPDTLKDVQAWFEYARRPAYKQNYEWFKKQVLLCGHQGKTYRVTGASRIGDIWLNSDIDSPRGYDFVANIGDCTYFNLTQRKFDLSTEPKDKFADY